MYLPSDTQPEFIEDNPHYERETKILYLLHGFSGDSTDWISGSNVMDVSRRYNLAIVMPSGKIVFMLIDKEPEQRMKHLLLKNYLILSH